MIYNDWRLKSSSARYFDVSTPNFSKPSRIIRFSGRKSMTKEQKRQLIRYIKFIRLNISFSFSFSWLFLLFSSFFVPKQEAAVDMVQKEADEVPNISTKGAELVVSMEGMEMNAERRNGLHSLAELKESADIIKRSWDCRCISPAIEESLDRTKIREPRSAPF